jgi:enamine deaminase RidA (YjgF/YER057c/UK114 family)
LAAVIATVQPARAGGAALAVAPDALHLNPPGMPGCAACSQVVVAPSSGNLVHIAGQTSVGMDFHVRGATLADQLPIALDSLDRALAAGKSSRAGLLDLVVYYVHTDGQEPGLIVPRLKAYFGAGPAPAISIVGVPALVAPGMLIEIEGDALAAKP